MKLELFKIADQAPTLQEAETKFGVTKCKQITASLQKANNLIELYKFQNETFDETIASLIAVS